MIENIIYDLLKEEPFFANFLLGCEITYNHPSVKTAACTFKNKKVIFMFNTDFLNSLTRRNRTAIVKHEIMHVLLDHVGNRLYNSQNMFAKNMAMDCAINQFITGLPENAVTLSFLENKLNKKLLPQETWEYYYHQLKNLVNDSDETHDHDIMNGNDSDEIDESFKRALVKDLTKRSLDASAGKIPNGLSSVISNLNEEIKINWKQQLRNIVCSAKNITTKPNRLKTHRRFDLDQPGKKKNKKLVLGVCLDSSGSITDESFSKFLKEIYNLAKMTSLTYLINADSEVQKIEIIKDGKVKSEKIDKRHGNGGTAYQPAIDVCKNKKCDIIVYFGDMDCADRPENPGIPFIWVRVGKQPPPADFGRIIDLD